MAGRKVRHAKEQKQLHHLRALYFHWRREKGAAARLEEKIHIFCESFLHFCSLICFDLAPHVLCALPAIVLLL